MRIWIDLANSPHVPFFSALIPEFVARGNQVEITARDFAQTVELATNAGMMPHVIGGHGGGKLTGKAGNLVGRAAALRKWARDRGFDLAVSHNSYAQIAAAAKASSAAIVLTTDKDAVRFAVCDLSNLPIAAVPLSATVEPMRS